MNPSTYNEATNKRQESKATNTNWYYSTLQYNRKLKYKNWKNTILLYIEILIQNQATKIQGFYKEHMRSPRPQKKDNKS